MTSAYLLSLEHLARTYLPDRSGRIVELGSGWGEMTRKLVDLGYERITAIDFDTASNANIAGLAGVEIENLDVGKVVWPLEDASAQAVLIYHVIEHMWDPDHMLREAVRVLRPGGHLLVATPDFSKHYKDFYEDRTHIHPYVPKSLRAAVEAAGGVEVVKLSAFNVRRPLGRLPALWRRYPRLLFTGNSILCVARKGG